MELPASVEWTEVAFERYQRLPPKIRDLIIPKLESLKYNPQMYQIEPYGHWEGLRRMVVGRLKLYYNYAHLTHTIYIETIDPQPL